MVNKPVVVTVEFSAVAAVALALVASAAVVVGVVVERTLVLTCVLPCSICGVVTSLE